MDQPTDRNTQLAVDRTVLAVERTYAAWVRTGLAGLASGIAAKKFLPGLAPDWVVVFTGASLVLFGAFCFLAAVWREAYAQPLKTADMPHLNAALLIAVNGLLVLVAIAALFAVVLGPSGGE